MPESMTSEPMTWGASGEEAAPPRVYTSVEAAVRLGVREDSLIALLPDTAVADEALLFLRFTDEDVERLDRLIRLVRQFYAESVYGGGDL